MGRGGKRPGSGRKPGQRTERMEIRIDPKLKKWLLKEFGVNKKSWAIEKALKIFKSAYIEQAVMEKRDRDGGNG